MPWWDFFGYLSEDWSPCAFLTICSVICSAFEGICVRRGVLRGGCLCRVKRLWLALHCRRRSGGGMVAIHILSLGLFLPRGLWFWATCPKPSVVGECHGAVEFVGGPGGWCLSVPPRPFYVVLVDVARYSVVFLGYVPLSRVFLICSARCLLL